MLMPLHLERTMTLIDSPVTPSPESSDEAAQKRELELRKLRAETERAERDLQRLARADRLQLFAATLPAFAITVSVLGLLFSLISQLQQAERSEAYRREDQFSKAVGDFASGSETVQLAAVVTLERFIDNPEFHGRLEQLFIASLCVLKSTEVRKAIQQQLVSHSDAATLTDLAAQNRRITAELRR